MRKLVVARATPLSDDYRLTIYVDRNVIMATFAHYCHRSAINLRRIYWRCVVANILGFVSITFVIVDEIGRVNEVFKLRNMPPLDACSS